MWNLLFFFFYFIFYKQDFLYVLYLFTSLDLIIILLFMCTPVQGIIQAILVRVYSETSESLINNKTNLHVHNFLCYKLICMTTVCVYTAVWWHNWARLWSALISSFPVRHLITLWLFNDAEWRSSDLFFLVCVFFFSAMFLFYCLKNGVRETVCSHAVLYPAARLSEHGPAQMLDFSFIYSISYYFY